ncbi:hypothetical protein Ami103574_09725 [Aminipila butyrica]|uniref:Membrane protein YkvI n=1 Tax=Aminipila butyrica TaxID=433296 RepID=A0A858BXZ9_9FIRM|nr:alanine:cation symporter family protein [Aminipila butyrica]QIB69594.1 hypothetical protein Ami103574_09725 [Aminipila butyrica]
MEENHKLGILSVALMYVGTIMGAGFASGREIWQFFCVFEEKGYIGIFVIGALFLTIGLMTSHIARTLNTNDMGKVIVPGNNEKLVEFVGYFMALMLFTVLITMSSAGGALFHQQLGQSRILGGAVIICLVILTVIGGFERVAKVFRFIMPVLVVVVVSVCLMVIFMDLPQGEEQAELVISPLTPNWFVSAMQYISYNVLALVPIVATASVNAKSRKHALLGTALGAVFLGLLAFVLGKALFTDMGFSQAMDMPMLAYSAKISKGVNLVYTGVLIFAIYASATSNYYGFTTKMKTQKHRKLKIVIIAWLGFLCGLIGFTNVISFMFPIEGFMGFAIIAMVVVNFFQVIRNSRKEAALAAENTEESSEDSMGGTI